MVATAVAAGVWFSLQEEKALIVTTVTPERGQIQAVIRVTGEIVNDRTVTMTALVDGQIQAMPVRKGDRVKAGQTLTVLDKREADARLQKAKAELALEKQAIAESSRKLKRQRELAKTGGTSTQLLDDARAALNAASARYKVAEAVLKIEKIHREKVTVTAPFDGVITEKTTEVGQWVEAGTALFTLVAVEGREIEVNIDAGDSATVETGQIVSVSSDAWPDQNWQEKILRIAPAITADQESALNTFATRISLGSEAPELLLGQQVDARIHTATREDVIKLPFGALIEKDDQSLVAVIQNNQVALLPVQTGLEDFTHVEITEGLSGDEQVILSEGRELKEGEDVQPEASGE